MPAGPQLRGAALASSVIVTGADGYRVSFGLAEFDPDFTDRVAILADKRDGEALPANAAPFQLILSGEKRPARWVRQVISIELPTTVILQVTDTMPAIKGATAQAQTKAATLETGLEIQVPAYLEPGEYVQVDTRDARFVARAKG